MVEAGRHESRRPEPPLERGAPVDAHVAPGRVVVLVGERPVDRFGDTARHRDGHRAARAQHARQLAHGGDVVGNVLEDLRRDDPVERRRPANGSASASPWTAVAGMIGRQLAGLHHGGHRGPDLGHLVGPGVESDDRGTPARRFEGMAAESAPEVEQAIAGTNTEPVVVDGQHQAASGEAAGSSGSTAPGAPGKGRPSRRAR